LKYGLIAFDLGNTIIRFDHNIAAGKISGRFGVDKGRVFEPFFDSDITRRFETGKISPEIFHVEISELLGIKLPYEEFVDIWNDIFWEDKRCSELVRRLKAKYRICLLSNVNKLHFEWIRAKFGIIGIFDHLVLSYLVGAQKPDRKIYEYASRVSGVGFDGILYIDDRADLIEAAKGYGIESVPFKDAPALEDWLLEHKVL